MRKDIIYLLIKKDAYGSDENLDIVKVMRDCLNSDENIERLTTNYIKTRNIAVINEYKNGHKTYNNNLVHDIISTLHFKTFGLPSYSINLLPKYYFDIHMTMMRETTLGGDVIASARSTVCNKMIGMCFPVSMSGQLFNSKYFQIVLVALLKDDHRLCGKVTYPEFVDDNSNYYINIHKFCYPTLKSRSITKTPIDVDTSLFVDFSDFHTITTIATRRQKRAELVNRQSKSLEPTKRVKHSSGRTNNSNITGSTNYVPVSSDYIDTIPLNVHNF